MLKYCIMPFVLTGLVLTMFGGTLQAQSGGLREVFNKYSHETGSSTQTRRDDSRYTDSNSGKKRLAVFFVASHQYDFITGIPEKDALNEEMMTSFFCSYSAEQKLAIMTEPLLLPDGF